MAIDGQWSRLPEVRKAAKVIKSLGAETQASIRIEALGLTCKRVSHRGPHKGLRAGKSMDLSLSQ